MIFDGVALARAREESLRKRLLAGHKRPPKMVSILVGHDPASELYTKLKAAAAERVGIEFEIVRLSEIEQIRRELERISKTADGIMIQLPLPGVSPKETEEILQAIPLNKDVDGLRWKESGIMPATVRAVLLILTEMAKKQAPGLWQKKFVVVGGTGAVGKPLVEWLRTKYGVEAEVVNRETADLAGAVQRAEVLISCTGKPGIITGQMVRPGVVAIDVGSPRGEMTKEVEQKALVVTPVPHGVGPVTIASLMENMEEIYNESL